MILIDAIYIHDGGGRVLLDYLIEVLEQTGLRIFYLLDNRIPQDTYNIKKSNEIKYLDSSLIARALFYKNFRSRFAKIFILGNVPPLFRQSAHVSVYFHNPMYISVPKDFSAFSKFKYILKVFLIKQTLSNVDNWLIQSTILKSQFEARFGESNKTLILPFYPPIKSNLGSGQKVRKKGTLFYVSNAQPNKNHERLIQAFCKIYDKIGRGELILTVSNRFPKVISLIEAAQNNGYPISNIGFIDRESLSHVYQEVEYVIFPSTAESFGLGLVEGIEMGCKIIAADLPYTYAVCSPSITFDPLDIDSIAEAIEKSFEDGIKQSISKVQNEMEKFVNMLSS